MNSLSWMLYLADVAQSASGFLGFVTILGGIVGAGSWAARLALGSSPTIYSWDDKEAKTAEHRELVGIAKKASIYLPIAALATGTLSVAIPTKDTIYAIAASEMGEQALKTPTADKAFKALNAWLDRQIAPEPSK